MEFRNYEKEYDFVVVGGGFTGICCAVEAARAGLKTALVSNRGFIGGNSGAEVRCPVDGADGEQQFNYNARETGLIEEIRLRNLHDNRDGNSYRWDMVLMDFIGAEPLLDLYLNTCVDRTETEGDRIVTVSGIQTTTEKRFTFRAPLFADNTGDGTLAVLSGCGWQEGSESRETYDEKIAGPEANGDLLLSTLTYYASDKGHPIRFYAPDNSFDMAASGLLEHREIPREMFERFVWFYEVGAGLDQVADAEEINLEHRKLLHSVWDYIKSHDYGADNYDFDYIAPYPGKRESRRIEGLLRLTEKDLTEQRDFPDAVGYGGWAIDLHSPKGFYGTDPENWWVYLKGLYSIPLRAAVAKDCRNLFIIGRCFSVSHVASGSTRLNATLATVGQAVGLAAALCVRKKKLPRALIEEDMEELHRAQYRRDQTVLGYRSEDPADAALRARVTVSSELAFSLSEPEEYFPLNTVLALSLPVRPELKKLDLFYRSEISGDLELRVYRADKPQNYNPGTLLCRQNFRLEPAENGSFTLDLSALSLREEFLFIEFEGDAGISLAASTKRLPCVCSVMRKDNLLPNVRDYESLEMMSYEWMKLGMPLKLRKYSTASQPNVTHTLCFRPEPAMSIYGGENAVNGFLRPYGRPNLWAAKRGEAAELTLEFESEKDLKEITLTFNSDLNFRVRNVKPYDFNRMPEVVRDFRVLCRKNGRWELLTEEKGNYQRFRSLPCDVRTDALKLELLAGNGSDYLSLYAVDAYTE